VGEPAADVSSPDHRDLHLAPFGRKSQRPIGDTIPVHPLVAALDLEALMREALGEAETAGAAGEYPIGAVVAIGGEIVSRGRSRQAEFGSQLRHAELEALLGGGEALWERHDEAVLFTTVEPCPLCLGAAVMADVPHIVFAHPDPAVQSQLAVERV